jgi:hypothetical protein
MSAMVYVVVKVGKQGNDQVGAAQVYRMAAVVWRIGSSVMSVD